MLYLAVLLTVLGKAALVSECVSLFLSYPRILMRTLVCGQNTLLLVSANIPL